jgi:hypothetical protein
MATQDQGVDISLKASTDLSSYQFYFVKMTASNGQIARVTATTDPPLGVLQNAPDSGREALVRILGHSKVVGGEAITAGNLVGSGKDGKATVITPGTETTCYTAGIALQTITTDSQVAEVVLFGGQSRAA